MFSVAVKMSDLVHFDFARESCPVGEINRNEPFGDGSSTVEFLADTEAGQ